MQNIQNMHSCFKNAALCIHPFHPPTQTHPTPIPLHEGHIFVIYVLFLMPQHGGLEKGVALFGGKWNCRIS